MPHYNDGTEAKIHDVVRGKPYNVDHEITGVVVDVRPGDTCNVEVAFTRRPASPWATNVLAITRGSQIAPILVEMATDSGGAGDFALVHRGPGA